MVSSSPKVSVVIPCRNEEASIAACLDSIVRNDYPKERLEVLVVDGMSEDGTREILRKYAVQWPFIRMLDNPEREQQLALNIGIRAASGEIIARMDAHSTYKQDYLSQCVRALQEHPADNVGGRWITVPRDNTLIGKAICLVTSCFFGVGNAYYRLTSLKSKNPALNRPRWEINVAYFCCRREVFDQIGLFNERLDRSEDIDFRARLKKAGYRTLFVPEIECYYSMRARLGEFLRHMFKNGRWVLLPLNRAPNISFSPRHIVPFLFLITLITLGVGSFFHPASGWILGTMAAAYGCSSLYFSFRIAVREKEAVYFFLLPFLFLALHITYGLGSLTALFRLVSATIPSLRDA